MRVLHVIPAVAPRYGGPSRAIIEMCRAIQQQGIEPLIATTDADGPGRLSVELGKPVAYQNVPTVFFSRQWSESFKYSRPLAQWLHRNVPTFDLVHIHAVFSHACMAAARTCQRHSIAYVVRPLGTLDPWSMRQKPVRKRLLWLAGARQMVQEASALHFTTAAEQRLAETSLGLERGVVIPLGIEEDALRVPSGFRSFRQLHTRLGAHPYVLVLSRLHPKKRLDLFVDVFLRITHDEALNHWYLVIAGEGEPGYMAELQRLVQQKRGEDRVLFTGWLDGVEKAAALRGAALLALPSYQENFGLSVVEALACGVPVLISSSVNLADEILAAQAGWVASLDRNALEAGLAEALREDSERARRGAAGRMLARRFDWSQIASDLVNLYRSINDKTASSIC